MQKILLGCSKLDVMIAKFDDQTINGVHFHYLSRRGIQAVFEHDAPDFETAEQAAKSFYKTDKELSVLTCAALNYYSG